jgi:hypothetical protein
MKIIVKKCHFNTVIRYFLQPPVSPFFKGELDDDLAYSPLSKLARVGFFVKACKI